KGDAIRAFQRANGIDEDGKVRRNDATMRALKAAVQPKIRQAVAARAKTAETPPTLTQTPRERSSPTQLVQRPSTAMEPKRDTQDKFVDRSRRLREKLREDRTDPSSQRAALAKSIGKWPRDKAWKEIEDAMARPNATINPRNEEARIWAIRNNRKAVFDIKENPSVKDDPADHRDHARASRLLHGTTQSLRARPGFRAWIPTWYAPSCM
ncbi:MAG: peptidoglycan-binding domain-containing protein, partial [Proteobacteria bacterium]|nr:peptidoglycan-binding domain-containing protein [Pseudomonadota bacterium]